MTVKKSNPKRMVDTLVRKEMPLEHYYGDIVRRIFVGVGITMGVCLPFFQNEINLPVYLSILAIVVIVFLAGWENPRNRFIIILNTIVSVVGCAVFEYTAVSYYLQVQRADVPFFWINQVLALAFFVAIYFSSKTVRGVMMRKGNS